MVQTNHPAKIALVGAGGSGKSTLACALGHRLRRAFGGRVHWLRIGAWDARTVAAMMALRFGLRAGRSPLTRVRRSLRDAGPSLIVLDNHEVDASTAALLDGLRGAPASFIITARRCLLSGVTIFPVVPPLVTAGRSPFPRLDSITRLLRWNPVALDLADALVEAGMHGADQIAIWLRSRGIERVRPVDHEDDLPEVGLLVELGQRSLGPSAKRMLAVLAHAGGDSIDAASLGELARAGGGAAEALAELVALRLVQEPLAGRFTLHATVSHAVQKHTEPMPDRLLEHYAALLERDPSRLEAEQTHLFAAMDHAQERGDLATILRLQKIADRLAEA